MNVEATNPKLTPQPTKQENALLNLVANIIIPTVILTNSTKLNATLGFNPKLTIVIALAFPIVYGLYDFKDRSKVNLFSVLGVFQVVLMGAMTLLEATANWIAIKEAALPLILGIAVLISLKMKNPLVRHLFLNENFFNIETIEEKINEGQLHTAYEKLIVQTSLIFAGSFGLSAALNYGLAKYLLVASPGTEAFNEQIGQMMAMSFLVILIPSLIVTIFAIYWWFHGIRRLTNMDFEQIFKAK